MKSRWVGLWMGIMVMLGGAMPAMAQQKGEEAGVVAGAAVAPERAPQQERTLRPPSDAPLQWDDAWTGIRWWEYPTSVGLLAFGLGSRFLADNPPPNWTHEWAWDRAVLDAIAVRENPGHDIVRTFSDLSFYGSMAYRLVDSALLPGFSHRDSWHVAWKMSWIDLQAFAVVAAVEFGTQLWVGRVRPTAANCGTGRRGYICDENNVEYARSFIAGHTATATAAAGLTCLHHSRLPLYGGGLADKIACGVMVTNAVANGFARTMSERHYPSDALFGWAMGIGAGWILPRVLHYGWGEADPAETVGLPEEVGPENPLVFSLLPSIVQERPGVLMLGRF